MRGDTVQGALGVFHRQEVRQMALDLEAQLGDEVASGESGSFLEGHVSALWACVPARGVGGGALFQHFK
jgi:hypothetical protein